METNNSSSSGGSTGLVGGGVSAPQEGDFEAESIQGGDVFPEQTENIGNTPVLEKPIDLPNSEADARDIMDIPGTPHNKLEGLAREDDLEKHSTIESEPAQVDTKLEEFIKKLKLLLDEAEGSRT